MLMVVSWWKFQTCLHHRKHIFLRWKSSESGGDLEWKLQQHILMIVHIFEHATWSTKTMLLSIGRRPKVEVVAVGINTWKRAQVKVMALWLLKLLRCVILLQNNLLVYSYEKTLIYNKWKNKLTSLSKEGWGGVMYRIVCLMYHCM